MGIDTDACVIVIPKLDLLGLPPFFIPERLHGINSIVIHNVPEVLQMCQ